MLSEAVKLLKGEYVVRAIEKLKMDKAMLFCRTKVDCDNLEQHLNKIAGGSELLVWVWWWCWCGCGGVGVGVGVVLVLV